MFSIVNPLLSDSFFQELIWYLNLSSYQTRGSMGPIMDPLKTSIFHYYVVGQVVGTAYLGK